MLTRFTRRQVLFQVVGAPMGLMMLPSGDRFVSPLDPAWAYTNGTWARVPEPTGPTDVMRGVMSPAWVRDNRILWIGEGQRFSIATDSPYARLRVTGHGQHIVYALDDDPPMPMTDPLPTDGKVYDVPLFDGRARTGTVLHVLSTGNFAPVNYGLVVAADAQIAQPAPSRQKRLVAMGHSYPEGSGASDVNTTSMVPLIANMLNLDPYNQGWGGTDIACDREPGSAALARFATDVVPLRPDVLMVVYGLIAVGQKDYSPARYREDYVTFLRMVRDMLPDTLVYCSGISAINRGVNDTLLAPWNVSIRAATTAIDRCTFIDTAGWIKPENYGDGSGPVYFTADGVHLNDAGQAFFAKNYADAMR